MERKDSCSYLPRDDQSTGNFGMAKTFLISFLLRPATLLSLGTTRPAASGERKIKKFLSSLSAPILWYLLSNKINFLFFYLHTIFFQH